jgi:hypothetical protein
MAEATGDRDWSVTLAVVALAQAAPVRASRASQPFSSRRRGQRGFGVLSVMPTTQKQYE